MTGMNVGRFGPDFAARLREFAPEPNASVMDKSQAQSGGKSFLDHMTESISEVNAMSKAADTMATDLATGKAENIHEVMIASSEAGLSFNLMVQVRNKMLEAYQEIMRMPV